ncbi:DHA2 family efflux MFS transporter permease subunit [Actinacidiphila bryophytorum]|uniref:Drug resistance transporter, EmrB/QacA subfamily n=1 Tax=Actinacidiphila bryophytorum TaxID=1436133 RepID=A0A9W4H3C5_9ACTN|nr:DHA2 family efflux MFS transporter permease subunit [Actinacidiphila bryophytorum]MBM9440818.1 DHA2 family efflux MFS transporter permease subunit [Actinacidiphila bryophytorum]MBN6542610.1 DHA2 family efflux MFS transporter permease subunit [Actinacidiphila bryophytorum]CAG7647111.1 Drug resistance transporter, EmrB/QacA subfamily [Actinacidiphila bryophytorum]
MTSAQAWVLGLASLASFMMAMDSVVVSTALTTIRQDLTASTESLEWVVNAYNLAFAVLLLTGAALGDRFGRRRIFMGGLAVFTVASAACALSPDIGALIAFRALQGAGAAMVLPLSLTMISAMFPPQQRGKAMGLYLGFTGLATFSGPFIGGVIAEGLAWEWIFWLNLPVGIVTIALTARRVGESTGPNNRFDLVGVVLVTLAAFGLVWGLVRGNAAGWSSAEVLASWVLGAVLLVAFVRWEQRTKAPMLPMRFFRARAFSTANPANFLVFASLYGTLFFMAQYLQTVLGNGPLGAGLRLMPWSATLMVCAPIVGRLSDTFGERTFVVSGLLLQTVSMGWIALVADTDTAYGALVPPLVLSGIGLTMAMPAAQRAVVGAVRPQEIGQASGVFMMLRIFGGVLGVAVTVAVFSSRGGYASPEQFTRGFTAAMTAVTGYAALGVLIALGIPRRRPAPAVAPAPAAAQAPQDAAVGSAAAGD